MNDQKKAAQAAQPISAAQPVAVPAAPDATAQRPLTTAQVQELCKQMTMEPYQVRAIERAHGIGGAHD